MNSSDYIQSLLLFINSSPTPFHAVSEIEKQLKSNGFQSLKMEDNWLFNNGKKFYTTINGTALFAFHIGGNIPETDGFKLISAHSDSPCFKVKPNPEIIVDQYIKLNTEVYGGPILMSWFDRPLSIAGRVILKSDNLLKPIHKLINLEDPILTIPNLAIHLNRQVNEGLNINKQVDMLPLLSMINKSLEKDNFLLNLICKKYHFEVDDILDFDLFVYNQENGCTVGADNEFISSPRLDDLAMVHAGMTSLLNTTPKKGINLLCIFDNEEVGSLTKQGAGAPILKQIIERIMSVLGKNNDQITQSIYNSYMISADMAHALHPNYPEKHDPVNQPILNKGPVLKYHAGQKYTTDGESGGIFANLCQKADVPYQKFVNRSDSVGGSTLGNISTGQINFKTVDIGNPMLSMHSSRELSGVDDHENIIKVFNTFFSL